MLPLSKCVYFKTVHWKMTKHKRIISIYKCFMSSCLLYKPSILVMKPSAGTCFETHLPIDKYRQMLHDGFKEPPNACSSNSVLRRYQMSSHIVHFVVFHCLFHFFFVGVL